MAREAFMEIAFRTKTIKLIEQANTIINAMRAKGYTLTVRQLHYQFVSLDLYQNTKQNYQRLASVVDDARKAGLIDWDAIEDRTRYLRKITNYPGPERFLTRQATSYYAEDLWRNQEVYAEAWIEKDALLGVIERPCLEWRVPYFACRGYASSSELYEAGKRLARQQRNGKRVVIFHLGDHDPSGVNMTTVNDDSLNMFARSTGIEVRRLALNMNQVEEYSPPPNFAKDSDSRTSSYIEEYGTDECWELDALSPEVIEQLIRDAIESVVDEAQFDKDRDEEETNKQTLLNIADNWTDVRRYLDYRHRGVDLTVFGENDTPEEVLRQAEQDGEEEREAEEPEE